MSETGLAWKVWARRLRRRWTRRTAVSGSNFVWLRLHRQQAVARLHSTIRLSQPMRVFVNVPLVIPRTPAESRAGVRFVNARQTRVTLVTHAGEWRPVSVVRPAAASIHRGSAAGPRHDGVLTSSPNPGASVATRWLRRAGAVNDWQRPRTGDPRATVPAPRRLGSLGPARLRHEPLVVTPPPMTPRRPRRDTPPQPVVAAAQPGFGPPFGHDTGMSLWAAAPPTHPATMSGPALSALTDQVMRQINDRVRARRERLGKV